MGMRRLIIKEEDEVDSWGARSIPSLLSRNSGQDPCPHTSSDFSHFHCSHQVTHN